MSENNFSICSFRTILSIVTIVIIIPVAMMNTGTTDISLYITICVFVLGKYVDLIAKILDRPSRLCFWIYIVGLIIGMMVVAMCFFATLGIGYILSERIIYDCILIAFTMFFGFVDVAEFINYLGKVVYTKEVLNQI